MGLIYFGDRFVRKRLGWVADFCPFCRTLRSHKLIVVRRVPHLWYISIGPGGILRHERRCRTCNGRLRADRREYAAVSRRHDADLEELITETFPEVRECYADCLKFEQLLRQQRATSEEREVLLQEPFRLLSDGFDERCSSVRVDELSTVAFGLGLVVWIGAAIYAHCLGAPFGLPEGGFIGGAAAAGALGFLVAIATDVNRFLTREIIPPLARALYPLAPSPTEISDVLSDLRRQRLRIGRFVRARPLLRQIEALQLNPPDESTRR